MLESMQFHWADQAKIQMKARDAVSPAALKDDHQGAAVPFINKAIS